MVGSFTWHYVLYVLGGNVCWFVVKVAMCFVGSFRWQCVFLSLLGGQLSSWVF